MQYEPVIGLEVHAQLQTDSKMFCRCSTDYSGAEPNTHTCPVCAGFPGVLPVINERAVELAIRVGLALGCRIAGVSRFDRKHYPYPDLPKGYQISQYDLPLAVEGRVPVVSDGTEREIGIIRVHMEEDTAKANHRRSAEGEVYTLVDLNRSGVPLLEIVSAPDLRSPAEAREYVARLRQTLRYIDACSGNMEQGALRVDANVSIRPVGSQEFGAKVEIKNLNSFRAVERALEYEIRRQTQAVESGAKVSQETRGWDEAAGETLSQRTKEYASDYRYFPEPDLPPLIISEQRSRETEARMVELPRARRTRFVEILGLPEYDAELLTASRETADYFELALVNLGERVPAKQAANWITGDLFRLLKSDNGSITDTKISPSSLAEIVTMVHDGKINPSTGRQLLEEVYVSGGSPGALVAERGMAQISGESELVEIVHTVLEKNPRAVEDYNRGKHQAVAFLVGQVMRETKGRAKAESARSVLLEQLQAGRAGD